MSDSLVMHLALDEVSGLLAADSSVLGTNPGYLLNGATFTGETVRFDGQNDLIHINDSPHLNLGAYAQRTIALSFKVDDKNLTHRKQVIYEEGGGERGLNIYIYDSRLYVGGWNVRETGWRGTFLSTDAISSEQWYHLALVLDAPTDSLQANALTAYLDGERFASGEGSVLAQHKDDIGIGNLNSKTKFHDGNFKGTGSHGFAGEIDDVRVYNSALSASAVAAIANADFSPGSPILIEAEDLRLTNFLPETRNAASGTQVISLIHNQQNTDETGVASLLFAGSTGSYKVEVGYFDENDGESFFTVTQNSTLIDTWKADKNLGSSLAVSQTFTTRTVATNLVISRGDKIAIQAKENAGEPARLDYLKFTPLNADALSIMPLGDSLTTGQNRTDPLPGAYRIQLLDRFNRAGIDVDFVGSQSNGPASLSDKDHQGHGGWRIQQITDLVKGGILRTHQPEFVTLMIGTNDISQGKPFSQIKDDFRRLVDEITGGFDGTLYVSSIPTRDPLIHGEAKVRTTNRFNDFIQTLVSNRAEGGEDIYFVDAGGSLTVRDLASDGLHPNATGHNKIGDVWYEAITTTHPDIS